MAECAPVNLQEDANTKFFDEKFVSVFALILKTNHQRQKRIREDGVERERETQQQRANLRRDDKKRKWPKLWKKSLPFSTAEFAHFKYSSIYSFCIMNGWMKNIT